jgi:pimeloyl-ACP methyl ester carboxylesterase
MCWEPCFSHAVSTAYVDVARQRHQSRLRHKWERADGTSTAGIELYLDPARNVAAAAALKLALPYSFGRLAGLGDQARPAVDWNPAAYAAFLEYLLEAVARHPHAVITAGHAAAYALAHACARPGSFGRLVLMAPTWRGPLPTIMNGRRPFFNRICKLVDLPVLGPLLYKLNVNRVVVRYMAAGHVYADPAWLSDERQREKLAVTRAPGSRFASIRFVTGELDPIETRQ